MLILSKGVLPVFALAQRGNKKARCRAPTGLIVVNWLSFDQFVGDTDQAVRFTDDYPFSANLE